MSLLQDERLDMIEDQGRARQIYKIELFITVLLCIGLSAYVLSLYVPAGESSIPITLEAILFAIVLALFAAPYAGRLIAAVFALACVVFVAVKINYFGNTTVTYYASSFYLWIFGAALFLLVLIGWKVRSYVTPENIEAREYEKEMRRLGKW